MTAKPRILFACRANAGRSVAGKVLAEYYAGDDAEVYSAGSEPGDQVHPEVANALTALGLSVAREVPKAFDPNGRYDVVVTMGCGEACPVYVGARYEDWPIEDPQGQAVAVVREIVHDIDERVRDLLRNLLPDTHFPASAFAGRGSDPTR
jgi:arsenate reductase (thioredoxin)